MNWAEMFSRVQKALERQGLRPSAQDFVRRLEQDGLTILPLQARYDADVYGTAVIVKTKEGYAVLDPASTLVINERAARLDRIAAVYPEAAAEARRAGRSS